MRKEKPKREDCVSDPRRKTVPFDLERSRDYRYERAEMAGDESDWDALRSREEECW